MQLILATGSPANTIYTDASGAPRYKVATPLKLHHRTTTISSVVDGDIPLRRISASTADSGVELETTDSSTEQSVRFAHLATIDWRVFESSVIRFRGRELLTHELFRKVDWGAYGRHRVFTGQDGKEYKWILGAYTSQLVLNDDHETVVAQYRPEKLGIFSKPRKASLEISSPFEHMVDEIMVTFVYIEHLRKKKERAARSPTLLNK